MSLIGGNLVMEKRKQFFVYLVFFNKFVSFIYLYIHILGYLYRYFRHASGEMVVISRAVAQFISINR